MKIGYSDANMTRWTSLITEDSAGFFIYPVGTCTFADVGTNVNGTEFVGW